jgi:hypothetical protein
MLISAVEARGTASRAEVAADLPGRSEIQCWNKWQYLPRKVAATSSGALTVEEEKMLVSATETFGTTTSWADIAANVLGRNEIQCINKWKSMSKKSAATASDA